MKRMAAVAATAMALAACGGSGGEKLGADATTTAAVETTTAAAATTTTVEVTTTTAAPADMPELIGKSATAADELLRSLGVEDVRVTEKEHISKPGTVLDQVPRAGRPIKGPVDLTVAAALAPMPDWTGKPLADARKYFEERGVTVTTEEVLDDTVQGGSIMSSTPSTGQSVSSEVKLVVAKTPVTLYLAEVEPVESTGNCSSSSFYYQGGDIAVNGATQQRSVWTPISRNGKDRTCSYDINLGRDWSRFKGNLGVSDTSTSTLQCRFEIFLDGNPVFNQAVGLGVLAPFDVDITNVLRMRLILTPLTADSPGDCVWASARLIGSGGS